MDKTIDRILKLLALSKGGTTEGEARLALEKAQELMASANLTMAELEASGRKAGEGSDREKSDVQNKSPYKWHRDVMMALAKLNSCHCMITFTSLRHTSQFSGYQLIGREANVVSARVMFTYLVQTVERLGREWAGDKSRWFTTDAYNFKRGCAERVIERLEAKQEEDRQEQTRREHEEPKGTNAVVMANYYASEADLNNDMLYGREPGTTARMRAEREAKSQVISQERADKAEHLKTLHPGLDSDVLWWMINMDMTLEAATIRSEQNKPKPETESQKRRREQRDHNYNERYWNTRDRQTAYQRTGAYRDGHRAGNDVGLNAQVDRQSNKGLR